MKGKTKLSNVSLHDSLFAAVPGASQEKVDTTSECHDPNKGTTGVGAVDLLASGQSLLVLPLYLDIGQIDCYEHNPRQAPNERFTDIKESIRANGLDQALAVTRKPGEQRYFIYKGGNTRLAALKELLDETGEDRFRRVRCEVHPFQGDIEGIAGHLRENDQRGEMVFIDRAAGVMQLRRELEAQYGQALSLRQLEAELTALGLAYSASHLSKFEYGVVLNQFIPLVLSSGVGKSQLENLRKLEGIALQIMRFAQQAGLISESLFAVSSGISREAREQEQKAFRLAVYGVILAATDRAEGWAIADAEGAVMLYFMEAGLSQEDYRVLYDNAMTGQVLIPGKPLAERDVLQVETAVPKPPRENVTLTPALGWKPPQRDVATQTVEEKVEDVAREEGSLLYPPDTGSKNNQDALSKSDLPDFDEVIDFTAAPQAGLLYSPDTGSIINQCGSDTPVGQGDTSKNKALGDSVGSEPDGEDRVGLAVRLDQAISAVAVYSDDEVERWALPDEVRELVTVCRLLAASLGGVQ